MTRRERGGDVVLVHVVHVTFDGGENEVIDSANAREVARDRMRLGEIESDAPGASADLLGCGIRAGLVPPSHGDVAPVVGVGLRELAAESLRAADDEDGVGWHRSLLSLGRRRPPATGPAQSGRSPPSPRM